MLNNNNEFWLELSNAYDCVSQKENILLNTENKRIIGESTLDRACQELSLCQFSSRSEKVGLEDVTLFIRSEEFWLIFNQNKLNNIWNIKVSTHDHAHFIFRSVHWMAVNQWTFFKAFTIQIHLSYLKSQTILIH
jgi:hypothetical protein